MAHTYVSQEQWNAQTGNPISLNHTPGAAATVCIMSISVGGAVLRTGGPPVIDGTTATEINEGRAAAESGLAMWYVAKAFTGDQFTIGIPNTIPSTCHIELVMADAGVGYNSVLTDDDGGTVPGPSDDGIALAVTSSAAGDFLYGRVACGENKDTDVSENSTDPTKTLVYSNDHGAYSSKSCYGISDGAGTENFSWVWVNDDGAAIACCFASQEAGPETLLINKADSARVSDSAAMRINPYFSDNADAANLSDSASMRVNPYLKALADSGRLSDAATIKVPFVATDRADSASVKDAIQILLTKYFPGISDSAALSDAVSILVNKYHITKADLMGLSDVAIVQILATFLSTNKFDSCGISDVIGITHALNVKMEAA